MTDRTDFITGLRAFADWLDTTDAPAPAGQSMLLSLDTVTAVEEFAATHGLTVTVDAEGNASCDLRFGPITYHTYGYRDFAEHCTAADERRARSWAEKNGVALVRAGESA